MFRTKGDPIEKSRKTLKRANQNVSVDQVISNRILILTLTIVVCFLVIFLRLFYLQIISYNDYTAKREDYTSIKQYTSAPRGQIYDCKGRILAKTVVSHNIVFTSPNNFDEDDYELYAKRIVKSSVSVLKILRMKIKNKRISHTNHSYHRVIVNMPPIIY